MKDTRATSESTWRQPSRQSPMMKSRRGRLRDLGIDVAAVLLKSVVSWPQQDCQAKYVNGGAVRMERRPTSRRAAVIGRFALLRWTSPPRPEELYGGVVRRSASEPDVRAPPPLAAGGMVPWCRDTDLTTSPPGVRPGGGVGGRTKGSLPQPLWRECPRGILSERAHRSPLPAVPAAGLAALAAITPE